MNRGIIPAWREFHHLLPCVPSLLLLRLARINYFSTDPDTPTWILTAPTTTMPGATIIDDYIASLYYISFTFSTSGWVRYHPLLNSGSLLS